MENNVSLIPNIPEISKSIILCVDDELIILRGLKEQLKLAFGKEYQVEAADNAELALSIIEEANKAGIHVPVVISDQVMPGIRGDEFLIHIQKSNPNTRKIMLTGQATADSVGNALNHAKLYRYLSKPWDSRDLILTVKEAIRSFEAELSLSELNRKLEHALLYNRDSGLPNLEYLRRRLEEKETETDESILALVRIESTSLTTKHFGVSLYKDLLRKFLDSMNSILGNYGEIFHVYEDEVAILSNVSEERFLPHLIAFKILLRSDYLTTEGISFRINATIATAKGFKDLYYKARLALVRASQDPEENLGAGILQYSEKMDDQDLYQININLGKRLNNAIRTGNILPYFQGILNNRTGRIEKFECLARIVEDGRVYTPASFIYLAKSTGLLRMITPILFEKALKTFVGSEFSFSINLSETELESGSFPKWVASRLDHYKIHPSRVAFEILETASLKGNPNHFKVITGLKEIGCSIAIDDFGVEHSNFSRLLEIQPDYIKIDGKFIQSLERNRTAFILTSAITELAHRIGAEVIAEFVGTREEFEAVKSLGIEYSQGYFIMEPSPEIPQIRTKFID
ncbi:cyclic diguanylate phosphodiesterase (EAL) domain protein [Leptospira fainei serovar Hurstbridge str. BUT 6]|uniref:Cyclic diguanylate phosphodiesterase (EAL) domain protein n=1 Tax=Leptospira fainei serovar Hurstbridge str. BUT 6 TaxID=1193011 RepID=S3V6I3_9LEPT|nr:EAL domain-containing protein [Leptospira fainei]EPG76284.1 cyclic diguanylate phosphodiesterase (EAL) domain protein [Leptospira fainei serovar Hurstbridge str. BUT 6]